jgi:hypothetical protein
VDSPLRLDSLLLVDSLLFADEDSGRFAKVVIPRLEAAPALRFAADVPALDLPLDALVAALRDSAAGRELAVVGVK